MEEKESIPLRLETNGSNYCNSEEAWELPWRCKRKKVISYLHWVEVSKPKIESNEPDFLVTMEVVWCTCAFDCEDLDFNVYPSGCLCIYNTYRQCGLGYYNESWWINPSSILDLLWCLK